MSPKTKFFLAIVDNLIWVILAVMMIGSALIVPSFLSRTNIINILYHSSILSMLVLAQALCLITGHIDLSIESTLGFAPTIAVLMMTKWFPGLNPLLGIFITLLIGGLIGLINGFFVVKLRIDPFLQTLAMLIMLRGLLLYLIPISVYGLPYAYTFAGGARVGEIPVAIFLILAVYLVAYLVLTRRPFGRYLYAVGGNRTAALISGINVQRVIGYTFIISGVLAAIAGLLMAGRLNAVTNIMGEGMVFMAFAGAVLGGVSMKGGVGNTAGILAGFLLLGVIDNALNLKGINPYLIYATKGLLIFVAIVVDQTKSEARRWLIMREEVAAYEARKIMAIGEIKGKAS